MNKELDSIYNTELSFSCAHDLDTLRYHLRGPGPEADAGVHHRIAAGIGELLAEGFTIAARRFLRVGLSGPRLPDRDADHPASDNEKRFRRVHMQGKECDGSDRSDYNRAP